jgi:pimeloyl-ACP methyl ester carboxylesterase
VDVKAGDVEVEGLRLHYREAGSGRPLLLLHGWPTSSFLYRNVLPHVAAERRAIALDLPGFGRSSKPLDVRYDFDFFARVLEGFLEALGVGELGLTVHDLGGPVGLYWASQQPAGRLDRLAILNTLVYPELSWAVRAFVVAGRTPGLRALLASQWGLKTALKLGVADPSRLPDDALEGFQAPFRDRSARRALLKAGTHFTPGGLKAIADWLPTVTLPVRVIYGAKDRILPDIARTVERLSRDMPQTEVTVFDDCGHFLQEERPDDLGSLLASFFAAPAA